MGSTVSLSNEAMNGLLGELRLPLLVVDQSSLVVWMNPAAELFAGLRSGDGVGRALSDVLGIAPEDGERIVAGRGSAGEWQTFQVSSAREEGRILAVQRKPIPIRDGEPLYAMVLEGAAWWDVPDLRRLSGSRFLYFETDASGVLRRGVESFSETLRRPSDTQADVSILSMMAEDARPMWEGAWERVRSGHVIEGFECKLMDGDGQARPFSFSLLPVMDVKSQVVGVRGTAIDVKPQQDLAYALEAAEERFSVMFQQSSDPVLILSLAGEILTANQTFETLTGIRSDMLFGGEKSWADFIDAADVPAVLGCIETCADKQDGTVECRILREDGEPVWFEQHYSVLHDERGQSKGLLAVARNIHERKSQLMALRQEAQVMQERNQRAQDLIKQLKEFFTRTSDLPIGITGFLDGICALLQEMYDPLLVYVHVAGRDAITVTTRSGAPLKTDAEGKPFGLPTAMSSLVMETGSPFMTNDLQADDRFQGDPLVERLRVATYLGAALRDSTGEIRGTIAMIDREQRPLDSLDVELIMVAALQVAARLRAEEQEEARRELEKHLRQSQKMEALGMLAGGIAHDFNNILSGILGFSSYLLNKAEPGSALHRDLGLIETSAERASELTRHLLAFARRKHFPKEPVPVKQVVRETLGILQRTLSKQIVIKTEIEDHLPDVMGDSGQINQVVMNLCLNAAEAMAEKGGDLTVNVWSRPLSPREEQVLTRSIDIGSGDFVTIEIVDTGTGMSDDVREHIFDPFFTTKSTRGGTGLGLSIVYGIVSNHGGDIQVISAEGEGTTFRVYLPAWSGEVPESETVDPADLTGDETILVVDDELIVRQMVTEILAEAGYTVESVGSGAEALDQVQALDGAVDLVLLDLVMPGMSGEETFTVLNAGFPGLPVLLTSGYAQEEVTDRLLAAGARDIVHKPYKSEALLVSIRKVLDSRPASAPPAVQDS